ncbi:MAG: M12 family metallopeptidase [Anaerolineae bacterium]|nr:M12 family metallopeptidase [Anaerolineae bacterium]
MRISVSKRFTIVSSFVVTLFLLCLASIRLHAQTENPPPIELQNGIPLGHMVIEGDIIVPLDFFEPSSRSGFGDTEFWPNGVVPFRFDDEVEADEEAAMLAAMAELESVANVDFVPRATQTNFITIRDSTGNNSEVGMQGGEQVINIFNWNVRFIMVHELMHALGFWHEQSRPDRDDYVTINLDNIDPANRHNFNRRDAATVYPKQAFGLGDAETYDFDSVMHYGQCAFAVGTCPPDTTLDVKPPNDRWQNQIGQRDHLSRLDILTVSQLYGQPDWRFVDITNSGYYDGSFSYPYHTLGMGVMYAPAGGTLLIQPGNYNETGTYSTAMTFNAPLGHVIWGE